MMLLFFILAQLRARNDVALYFRRTVPDALEQAFHLAAALRADPDATHVQPFVREIQATAFLAEYL